VVSAFGIISVIVLIIFIPGLITLKSLLNLREKLDSSLDLCESIARLLLDMYNDSALDVNNTEILDLCTKGVEGDFKVLIKIVNRIYKIEHTLFFTEDEYEIISKTREELKTAADDYSAAVGKYNSFLDKPLGKLAAGLTGMVKV